MEAKQEVEEIEPASLPPDLYRLMNHSSAIVIIDGARDSGKTDFSLNIAEGALNDGCISSIATNIISEDSRLKSITNFPDLDYYLKFGKGRKLFILDEAGESLSKTRWMSALSVKMLGTAQLIRHYNGRLIFIAPSSDFILKYLQHPNLKDCVITKKTREIAKVKNYITKSAYTLYDIPPTNIKFSQHPASFTLEKPINLEKLADYERDFYEYTVLNKSLTKIARETGRHDTQVMRNIKKFGQNYFNQKTSNNLP